MSDGIRREPDIDALARRAGEGERGAFEELVRRRWSRIHRWALARTGDPHDADDAAQEALVRLYRNVGSFAGRSAFDTWLYAVVRSAADDVTRRRSRRRRREVGGDEALAAARRRGRAPEALERLAARQAVESVRTLLARLSPRQREVFDLVELQGWRPSEAAELLDIDGATARAHLLRARRRLRELVLEAGTGRDRDASTSGGILGQRTANGP